MQVLELLRVEPSRSVILAALPKLADKPDRLAQFLWNLVVVSLRASVAKVSTGESQRVYQAAAYRIEQGELKSPLAIAKALRKQR